MDEAILCDEVDDTIFLGDLHGDREVVDGLGREEDIHGLLGEDWVCLGVVDLDDVQLCAGGRPHGEGEQLRILRGAVQSNRSEAGGVTFDCLADATVPGVELHLANNATLILLDTNNHHPLAVAINAIVDDLAALLKLLAQVRFRDMQAVAHSQVGMSVRDLLWHVLVLVKHIPVVDSGVCDQAERAVGDPLPEDDVLVHGGRLQLLLVIQVEDLDCSRLGLECDDVEVPVHDGAVGLDWSSRHIVAVFEVDDDNFGGCSLVLLLSNADVVVGFECLEGGGDRVSCCFRDAKRAGRLALGGSRWVWRSRGEAAVSVNVRMS